MLEEIKVLINEGFVPDKIKQNLRSLGYSEKDIAEVDKLVPAEKKVKKAPAVIEKFEPTPVKKSVLPAKEEKVLPAEEPKVPAEGGETQDSFMQETPEEDLSEEEALLSFGEEEKPEPFVREISSHPEKKEEKVEDNAEKKDEKEEKPKPAGLGGLIVKLVLILVFLVLIVGIGIIAASKLGIDVFELIPPEVIAAIPPEIAEYLPL